MEFLDELDRSIPKFDNTDDYREELQKVLSLPSTPACWHSLVAACVLLLARSCARLLLVVILWVLTLHRAVLRVSLTQVRKRMGATYKFDFSVCATSFALAAEMSCKLTTCAVVCCCC
jgi:hypothetical protein